MGLRPFLLGLSLGPLGLCFELFCWARRCHDCRSSAKASCNLVSTCKTKLRRVYFTREGSKQQALDKCKWHKHQTSMHSINSARSSAKGDESPPTAAFQFASSVLSRLSEVVAQLVPAAAAASLEVSQLLLESVGRCCYNRGCFWQDCWCRVWQGSFS